MSAASDPASGRASLAIDNLRAIVILLVLAFHSSLAYLNFLPHHPFAFGSPPFLWRAFPIVDQHRWIGFDLFSAWLDVFLMSFFFMLSGLFAWPSLRRKGAGTFLADRAVRLGLPFAVVALLLMPLAVYPAYLQSAGATPGFADFQRYWGALPLWPVGPMWFLWLLLAWDCGVAGLYRGLGRRRDAIVRIAAYGGRHPGRFLAAVAAASALAYVPLALAFGPSAWFEAGLFSFQESRPLHYAVYFFAGALIGAGGIERGLAAPEGPLARRWGRWLAAALALFAAWLGLTALVMHGPGRASFALQAADDLSFVLACFTSCFFVLGLALRCGQVRSRLLASLNANGYGMYLVHYVFVVWLQYALLAADLPAIVKGGAVFAATVLLSWSATGALRRVPAVAQVIGPSRRRRPGAARPLPHSERQAWPAE